MSGGYSSWGHSELETRLKRLSTHRHQDWNEGFPCGLAGSTWHWLLPTSWVWPSPPEAWEESRRHRAGGRGAGLRVELGMAHSLGSYRDCTKPVGTPVSSFSASSPPCSGKWGFLWGSAPRAHSNCVIDVCGWLNVGPRGSQVGSGREDRILSVLPDHTHSVAHLYLLLRVRWYLCNFSSFYHVSGLHANGHNLWPNSSSVLTVMWPWPRALGKVNVLSTKEPNLHTAGHFSCG